MRITRDQYGLKLANTVRERAACTRRKVGAVLLDTSGRIAATGYNGTPSGMRHCDEGGCPRGQFTPEEIPHGLGNAGHMVKCIAKHAERNAIDWAVDHGIDLSYCTLYITEQPCPECQALIAEHRIFRTVVSPDAPAPLKAKAKGDGILRPREKDILEKLSQGHQLAEAATQLFISTDTVKTMAARARRRLGAKNTTHAVAIALATGQISGTS